MAKLVVLMVTAFVDMIGLVMVIPLLPFYAEHLGATGAQIGVLIGVFSVAQLASAPAWGRMSDRHGRRPTLLAGLAISAVAYVVFAFAGSFWVLVVSRVVQGLGGGTVGVVQAYVTDIAAPGDRARHLGWLSAATSAGAVVGPGAGSLLAELWGRSAPGLSAAALALVNMAFAWRYLRESYSLEERTQPNPQRAGMREALWHVVRRPTTPAARLVWTYTVAIGAFYGMVAVFAQLLERSFGINEHTIGYFFMWFGAAGVVTRVFLLGRALRWLGEMRLARVGLAVLGGGLLLFPYCHDYVTLSIALVLMPLGTAFTFPAVTATLSRAVPSADRGMYMGVQQTFGGVARALFPWLDGVAFDRVGAAAPFVIAGLLCLCTIGIATGIGVPETGGVAATE